MKRLVNLTIAVMIAALLVSFTLVGVANADGPTVIPGQMSHTADLAEVRYKSLNSMGDKEIYIGINVDSSSWRAQRDITWVSGDNQITFQYDKTNDKLTTTVANSSAGSPYTLEYLNFSTQVVSASLAAYLDKLNIMRISVIDRHTSDVDFVNVYLDGYSLGDFSGRAVGQFNYWEVYDYDFSQGFTITGVVRLSAAPFSNGETNKVQLEVGYIPGSLTVTKTVDWQSAAPDPALTFNVCVTGLSYPGGDCKETGYNGGVITWTNLVPGIYTVTELITETSPLRQWDISLPDPALVKAAQASQTVITNTLAPGALEITKVVDWQGIASNPAQTFEICVTGPSHSAPNCQEADYDGGVLTWTNLSPGNYTITETDPGSAWEVTLSGSVAAVVSRLTTPVAITNTLRRGALTVTKTVDWQGVTPVLTQTFQICISGLSYPGGNCQTTDYDGGVLTWINLTPGVYTVTETIPGSRWTAAGSGAQVAVLPGQAAQAGVSNTFNQPSPDPGYTIFFPLIMR